MSTKQKKAKTILLLSGGIDSTVCLSVLKKEKQQIEAVFFDYGQLALKEEKRAAKRIADHYDVPLRVVQLELIRQKSVGEIFGRNLLFITAAAMKYGGTGEALKIVCGIHAGTPYADCSEHFVDQVAALLRFLSQDRIQFLAPLKTWSKKEVFQAAKRQRIPLELTYSCEQGGKECGTCASCLDRSALDARS